MRISNQRPLLKGSLLEFSELPGKINELAIEGNISLDRLEKYARQLCEDNHKASVVRYKYVGGGYRDICPVNRSLLIALSRDIIRRSAKFAPGDWYILRIQLSGSQNLELNDNELQFDGSTGAHIGIVYTGSGIEYQQDISSESTYSAVSIIFRPRIFDTNPQLKCLFSKVFEENHPDEVESQSSLTIISAITPMVELAIKMLRVNVKQETAGILLHGLALQLIGDAISRALHTTEGKKQSVHIKSNDIDKLQAVKNYLDENFLSPPTIRELSLWSGINTRKLKEGFKFLYGYTISDYALSHRMALACRLLREGSSVKEVASATHYQDQSSFSRAFKRTVGIAPSQYK